jgi:predicted restriction endonuclease
MSLLENYIVNSNIKSIKRTDLDYNKFGYTYDESCKELFEDELFFLTEQFGISMNTNEINTYRKDDWSDDVKDLYEYTCIISGETNKTYLDACHILELRDCVNFDINNGIVLTKNLHSQFDNYEWCINPDTKKVEVKDGVEGDICKYKNKYINILNYETLKYFKPRYKMFLDK